MEPHAPTVFGYIQHHFMFISLVGFPAFMAYLNAASIFFKVMGYAKLADFLGKLEEALIAARAAVKQQGGSNASNQNPTATGSGTAVPPSK